MPHARYVQWGPFHRVELGCHSAVLGSKGGEAFTEFEARLEIGRWVQDYHISNLPMQSSASSPPDTAKQ